IDRIGTLLSELPIGLIIFIVAIAFSFFGGDKKKPAANPQRAPRQDEGQSPIFTEETYGHPREERPAHTFASDERRAREERERQDEEVLVFGGLDFGRQGSLFEDEGDRDSQWGKTKYGFDDSEWSSESQWGRTFEN